jgi:RNA-binding protein
MPDPNATLTQAQKKHLRELGHKLKPVIQVGDAGVSEALFREFDSTIERHELIKVKVRAGTRDERDRMILELCQRATAVLIARVGNTALIYRRNAEQPRIHLPENRRR